LVLAHNDFIVRVLIVDGAQSNVSYFLSKCKKKASYFIPAHILQKHNPDGNFPVAVKHPVTGTRIFYIADPPHPLKKVGSSLEHRVLQYDELPMSKGMLSGEGSLMANLKLKDADFKRNQWTAMNVGRFARVLSGTMVKMIDEVCSNSERYPMPDTCPTGTDHVRLFFKVRKLCRHMNRWFDICDGKDTFDPFAKASKTSGADYADELLEILALVLGQPGEYQTTFFVTVDAFRSLKSVCYGFADNI
jgi:hypothetical protein